MTTKSGNNVYDFIAIKKRKQKEKEPGVTLTSYSIEVIDELCQDVTSDILSFLMEENILPDDFSDSYTSDIALLYESLKSFVYNTDNSYHPLQTMAYTLYDFDDGEEEKQLCFDFYKEVDNDMENDV